MAHLAAMNLGRKHTVERVITFGAPKACFYGTASQYKQQTILGDENQTLQDVSITVVNQRDIVAKVPFRIMCYQEVGQLVYINQRGTVHYGSTASEKRSQDFKSNIDSFF